MYLIHFTKLLNKKIEGRLKGLFVVFWQDSVYYAYSSLLKENNSANNRLPLGLSALFYKKRCFYFRICTMFLFYIKISDHGKEKKEIFVRQNVGSFLLVNAMKRV